MKSKIKEKYLHRFFVWGILLKALDGVLEIFAGIAVFFPGTLAKLAEALIHHKVIDNPNDFFATHFNHFLAMIVKSEVFASIYLLSHGVIKLFLVIALLRQKLWAYPTAIIIFILFIIYQTYRYVFSHSLFLLLLTLLDLVIIILTWHEYRYLKKERNIYEKTKKNTEI